jgi:hypothetical protein
MISLKPENYVSIFVLYIFLPSMHPWTKLEKAACGRYGHFLLGLRTFLPGNHKLLSWFCVHDVETATSLRTIICRSRIEDQGSRINDWELRIDDGRLRIEDWGSRIKDWWLRINYQGLMIGDGGSTIKDQGLRIRELRIDDWRLRIGDRGSRIEDWGSTIKDWWLGMEDQL